MWNDKIFLYSFNLWHLKLQLFGLAGYTFEWQDSDQIIHHFLGLIDSKPDDIVCEVEDTSIGHRLMPVSLLSCVYHQIGIQEWTSHWVLKALTQANERCQTFLKANYKYSSIANCDNTWRTHSKLPDWEAVRSVPKVEIVGLMLHLRIVLNTWDMNKTLPQTKVGRGPAWVCLQPSCRSCHLCCLNHNTFRVLFVKYKILMVNVFASYPFWISDAVWHTLTQECTASDFLGLKEKSIGAVIIQTNKPIDDQRGWSHWLGFCFSTNKCRCERHRILR